MSKRKEREPVVTRPSEADQRYAVKLIVNSAYLMQKTRIRLGNQLVADAKIRMGIVPGTPEDKAGGTTQRILAQLKEEYKRLGDAVARHDSIHFGENGIITDDLRFKLAQGYFTNLHNEQQQIKSLVPLVEGHPLWDSWFRKIKGIGPTSAAIILNFFDPDHRKTPDSVPNVSSWYARCGLDVVGVLNDDGEAEWLGRSLKNPKTYRDITRTMPDGTVKSWRGPGFDPWLKSKIWYMTTIACRMLKPADPYFGQAYLNYLHRYVERGDCRGSTDKAKLGHAKMRAVRAVAKLFLLATFNKWREVAGLPAVPYYSIEKLDRAVHSGKPFGPQDFDPPMPMPWEYFDGLEACPEVIDMLDELPEDES